MKLRPLLLLWPFLSLATTGCYPGGADEFGETDVVLTLRQPDADYQAHRTFAMPDSVVDLGELAPEDPASTISHVFDGLILQTIERNMEQLGYQLEDDIEEADLFVPVGAVVSTVWYTYTYYDYWGWWGFYPGGSGGFWVGYPVDAVGSYQTGTIVIGLVPTDSIEPVEEKEGATDGELVAAEPGERRAMAIWAAAINGLAGSSAPVTQTRIETTIDQAFSQSPYLSVR